MFAKQLHMKKPDHIGPAMDTIVMLLLSTETFGFESKVLNIEY